jgi:hypothetical protein
MRFFALFLISIPAFANLGQPIAFTITDRSGFPRTNEGITSGVPIPQSAGIMDARSLMLTDGQGQIVPSQMQVLARWGGSPEDASKPLKWLLVDFLGNVAANATATYYLADRTAPDGAPGVSVSAAMGRGYVTVNTGAVVARISRTRFTFLDSVTAGSTTFAAPNAGKFSVVANGVEYSSSNADRTYRAVVEQTGPIRAQVKVSGAFVSTTGDSRLKYEMRLIFYAGSTSVKVYPTIIFSEDMFAFKPSRIVLSAPLQLGSNLSYTIGNDGSPVTGTLGGGDTVYLHQYDHDGDSIVRNGSAVASGNRTDGWMDASDGSNGVSVWMRDMWQQYPLQLEYSAGSMNVYFWPGQDYTAEVNAKIASAMSGGAQSALVWPFAPGSNLDLTAVVANPGRFPVSVSNSGPPIAVVPGWGKQAVGTTQQVLISHMPGPNWSALNGPINATCMGLDPNGNCLLQLGDQGQFDATNWGPYLTGNCTSDRTISTCPQIGQVQTITDQNAQGMAKTWELQYNFHTGDGSQAAAFAARAQDRLLLVNTAWTASSLVFGRIHEADPAQFPRAEGIISGAFSNILTKDARLEMYGMVNYGDTAYTASGLAGGYGDRYFAHSRKDVEMVPWLLYARSGDPTYLWYGVARALHTMDVDVEHITTPQYTDANGNTVSKHAGGGLVSHGPQHWYSVYGGHPLGTEGEEPTLEYFSDAGLAMYYLLGYDRARDLVVERADEVIWYDAQNGGILDHLGARSFGGCLQIGLDAWKLTGAQKYMDLADKCFQAAVQHNDGNTLLTPMGYLNGDRFGNLPNWSIFTSSWANLTFAEYAEIKGPSAMIAGKNVRTEFLRFAKAMTAMGLTTDTTSAYTYGYQCKSTAYAYAYTSDPELLKFGKRWFDMLTAFPEGAPLVYGPSPDIHEWGPYLQNLPYCEWLVSQAQGPIPKPDWPPFYFHVPTGNPIKFLVNKSTDQNWSVTMTFDAGWGFSDAFMLSGTFAVDIVDPTGTTIQHNTFVTPNRMSPDSGGNPPTIAHGGVDNRVRTFSVPADGKTGEYTILVSVTLGQQPPGCPGSGDLTCYSTSHVAAALASSLGNLTLVIPPYSPSLENSPRLGRGLYYFNVPPGTQTLAISFGYGGFWLVDPDGVVYKSNDPSGISRYSVTGKSGFWALGTNISNDSGGTYGISIKSDGVKPLFSSSPQYYYDSSNYAPPSAYTVPGNQILLTFH